MLLELEDIRALSAGDAMAALAMVEKETPALLLIDIGLPGMNGFELARQLRDSYPDRRMTLIALTGREASGRDEPEAAAFDHFWTKPFDPKRLLAEVKEILATRA